MGSIRPFVLEDKIEKIIFFRDAICIELGSPLADPLLSIGILCNPNKQIIIKIINFVRFLVVHNFLRRTFRDVNKYRSNVAKHIHVKDIKSHVCKI